METSQIIKIINEVKEQCAKSDLLRQDEVFFVLEKIKERIFEKT